MLTCQGGNSAGGTHGINGEARTNTGTSGQSAPAPHTPCLLAREAGGIHFSLQKCHNRFSCLFLNDKRKMMAGRRTDGNGCSPRTRSKGKDLSGALWHTKQIRTFDRNQCQVTMYSNRRSPTLLTTLRANR